MEGGGTDTPQEGRDKELEREGEDQRQGTREQKRKGTFFSESVLRTQHESIILYPVPITDLLLAVVGLDQQDTTKGGRVYKKWVQLLGPNGEKVWLQAVIDGGAMRNILCASEWRARRHWLASLTPSQVTLSVADNRHIESEGRWVGVVDVAGAKATQSFEVFNSNGAFQIILGNPGLSYIQAVHKYGTDQIVIQTGAQMMTISNENEPRARRGQAQQSDSPRHEQDTAEETEKQPNKKGRLVVTNPPKEVAAMLQ